MNRGKSQLKLRQQATQSSSRSLPWLTTLYGKLSVSLLILLTLLGLTFLWVAQYTSDMYSQEVTQRLNGSIAMYVTAADQLIVGGEINQAAMDKLANRAMTINPTVEIYLLDREGRILTHVLPAASVKLDKVDMSPINHFLESSEPLPILGDDPRSHDIKKVFSVSAVSENG
jgi:two-component system OmpR family sensor kinase